MSQHSLKKCALIGARQNRALICSDAQSSRKTKGNHGTLAHIFRACACMMVSLSYTSQRDVREDTKTCVKERN